LALSGHRTLHCTCLLLTQRGHCLYVFDPGLAVLDTPCEGHHRPMAQASVAESSVALPACKRERHHDQAQNPPESSYRARNRCRFKSPARASGERTLCGLCLRPLRRRSTACRRGPSSWGPDPPCKMRIVQFDGSLARLSCFFSLSKPSVRNVCFWHLADIRTGLLRAKSITNTVRYTAMSPEPFKAIWR
jgi:hypothetical protein